jgi:dihydroflavonol-4-reductase
MQEVILVTGANGHLGNNLVRALEGVDTLYQVATVYKHWARNPKKEIIQANIGEGHTQPLRI